MCGVFMDQSEEILNGNWCLLSSLFRHTFVHPCPEAWADRATGEWSDRFFRCLSPKGEFGKNSVASRWRSQRRLWAVLSFWFLFLWTAKKKNSPEIWQFLLQIRQTHGMQLTPSIFPLIYFTTWQEKCTHTFLRRTKYSINSDPG